MSRAETAPESERTGGSRRRIVVEYRSIEELASAQLNTLYISRDGQFSIICRLPLIPGLARPYPGGEQEMLAIVRPLLLNPRLMLLDEPSQGLAPLIVKEVMEVVRRMRGEGLPVLLVEQNAPLSLSLADRAYMLDDGKAVHAGSAAELAKDKDLVDRLAGAGHKARH